MVCNNAVDDDDKIRVERNKKAEPVSPGSSNMVRSALSRRFNSHCHRCRPYHCQSKLLSPPQRDWHWSSPNFPTRPENPRDSCPKVRKKWPRVKITTINSEFNIWQMYCYTMVILMILLIIIAAIMFVIILRIMMIMTMILRNNAEWERRQEQHRLRVQWEDEKRDRETRRSWSSSSLLSSLGLSSNLSNIIVTLY